MTITLILYPVGPLVIVYVIVIVIVDNCQPIKISAPRNSAMRWRTFIVIHCYSVDAQLAMPKAPARAVNTVMRILRMLFQSVFIVLRNNVTH